MQSFNFKKVKSSEEALGISTAKMKFLAGGTTLIDLMKLEVETPSVVIDVNALPYQQIEKAKDGGLKIGAFVKNTDLAHNDLVKKGYAVLSEALLSGASVQLRNKATTAGNLLQRTRCVYFRDTSKACNKREPKSGCSAIEGHNRNLAILGTSASCIASNPSDMNVALTALEAVVHIQSAKGEREVSIGDFFLLPGTTPEKETVVEAGDLITAVSLKPLPAGTTSYYLKHRDRASYEFAVSSAAIVATVNGGKIERIRMAMGGIGAKPWRSLEAEKVLEGASPSEEKFKEAAAVFLKGAKPASENGFKLETAQRCLVYALKQALKSAMKV